MSATIETLTKIWEGVLQRSPIGRDDNFFDLGGTEVSAAHLLSEIARVYGRRVPSTTLRKAPTIAALAALLDQPLPQFTPFVQLKDGSELPPIFIAHGLSGTVQVGKLAKHIQTEHPIYGVQAKGINGMEEPFDRLEDMASFYLEQLEELYPHGPYILIGYSFGGLVALEIAQRLLDRGESVAQLVMLDAYPHPRFLAWPQRMRLTVTRVKSHLANMRGMPLSKAVSFVFRAVQRRLRMGGSVIDSEGHLETLNSSFNNADLQRVKQKAFEAYASYRPEFYRGKINFVTTEIKSFFPEDPAAVWGKLAEGLQVEVIPGDHLNIVTTHFETLASVLTRVLNSEAAADHNTVVRR